jgi:Glycosyl transferase family 2
MYDIFCAQTYSEKDLWVYDDSTEPSWFMLSASDDDPRVHYLWSPERLTIGAKRNALVAASSGDVIVTQDDDDWYSPVYISAMMNRLGDYDLAKLVVWDSVSAYDKSRWRWDTRRHGSPCYSVTGSGLAKRVIDFAPDRKALESALLGYGFSYVYPRETWEHLGSFPDINSSEDLVFIHQIVKNGGRVNLIGDCPHLALHTLHPKSTSSIFPQTRLSGPPDSALPTEIGGEHRSFWSRLWGSGTIQFEAGKTYTVLALVKQAHTSAEVQNRIKGYGTIVSYTDPAVGPETPRPGYRYVKTVIRVTTSGSIPRKVPAPFSVVDKSEIIVVNTI